MTAWTAVIVAAGRGERMKAGVRKAFLDLDGRPLFVHAVERFVASPRIDELVVVVHPDDLDAARDAVRTLTASAVIVGGGATRRESSLAGLRAARGDLVLIHDGCRPFVSEALIDRVTTAAERSGAALPVLPAIETLYCVDRQQRRVAGRIDRGSIVRAQTPQAFRRTLLLSCLERSDAALTDDVSAILDAGIPVTIVDGDPANRKLTYPEDLAWATAVAHRPRG